MSETGIPPEVVGEWTFDDLLGANHPYPAMHRVLRANMARARFKDHKQGPFSGSAAETITDHFFAAVLFFYHVKDWAKSDPQTASFRDWEKLIDEHAVLQVAADLANGAKHLRRDRSSRFPGEIRLSAGPFRSETPDTLSDFYRKIRVQFGGESMHPADFLDALSEIWMKELVFPGMRRLTEEKEKANRETAARREILPGEP